MGGASATGARRVSRRALLKAAGAGGLGLAVAPALLRSPAIAGAPPPEQVHLQFGNDAATEMTVSWASTTPVSNPRVLFGTAAGGLGSVVPAEERVYVDGSSFSPTGTSQVYAYHAALTGLTPGTAYVYQVAQDGAPPLSAGFTTAPRGRHPFRFTSFGDQGTGNPADRDSTQFGTYVVPQIEAARPLFHLINGDLNYANLNADRVGTWNRFFNNNMPSTLNRPWMPALGNHEVERGNGPQGYASYLTRYALPDNGITGFNHNWYAFTAGSVRVVSVDNNDFCLQNGGDIYINGYSGSAQLTWLDQTLAAARADDDIDWIVVFMHQLAMSSNLVNGSDLGVREKLLPLFDRHQVDLVLCGHDHDYERTYAVRGIESASATDRPAVATTRTDVIDTRLGTPHLCLGGGGAIPVNAAFGPGASGDSIAPPAGTVIVGPGVNGNAPDRVPEFATWSAVRDLEYAFGFITVDVDPGRRPADPTTLTVTYQRTALPGATPQPFDRFVLQRPRSDAPDSADLIAGGTAATA